MAAVEWRGQGDTAWFAEGDAQPIKGMYDVADACGERYALQRVQLPRAAAQMKWFEAGRPTEAASSHCKGAAARAGTFCWRLAVTHCAANAEV
jgi:hypothetical protein